MQTRCGVAVEVISGDEEGRRGYLGATAGIGPARGSQAVFDTGGSSSQVTFGPGTASMRGFSVEVDGVRYTARDGLADAVSEQTLADVLAAMSAALVHLDDRSKSRHARRLGRDPHEPRRGQA